MVTQKDLRHLAQATDSIFATACGHSHLAMRSNSWMPGPSPGMTTEGAPVAIGDCRTARPPHPDPLPRSGGEGVKGVSSPPRFHMRSAFQRQVKSARSSSSRRREPADIG
jgi:hypothetical protein